MKRNTITRLCSLAAAAVLAVNCIALTGCGSSASSAASSTASTAASAAAAGDNSCGEGVTWTLADGTLTISGTGRMTNFTSDSPAPWADQADQITNVEVEGTVTSIGFSCSRSRTLGGFRSITGIAAGCPLALTVSCVLLTSAFGACILLTRVVTATRIGRLLLAILITL